MLVQGEDHEVKIAFVKKLPKDKLQKVVVVCLVTLAAVVGVMELYVLNNWSALTGVKADITKLNDQILEAERLARGAQLDVVHRAEVKSFVEAQRAAMVSGDPFAWVVREITLLAQQHPVHVSALHPGNKVEVAGGESKSRIYTVGIDFSGSYDQIGEFVRDLENRFPTAEVRSLSVGGSEDDRGQHGASLTVTLRVQPAEPAKKAESKKSA
jgi:cell division protein FtsL